MMLLVKKYVPITNNEYLQHAYEDMLKEGERVKQLDVRLNAASETVKKKNEVHQDIKSSIKYLKGMLEANMFTPSKVNRAKAEYWCEKLKSLLDLKRKQITQVGQMNADKKFLIVSNISSRCF